MEEKSGRTPSWAAVSGCLFLFHVYLSLVRRHQPHLLFVNAYRSILTSLSVAISCPSCRFSAAMDLSNRIYVKGCVKDGVPWLSQIGRFNVDLTMYGSVLLVRQQDQPGIIATIAQLLGDADVNVSFMTVCRTARGEDAIMAIGIDTEPSAEVGTPGAAIRHTVFSSFVISSDSRKGYFQ